MTNCIKMAYLMEYQLPRTFVQHLNSLSECEHIGSNLHDVYASLSFGYAPNSDCIRKMAQKQIPKNKQELAHINIATKSQIYYKYSSSFDYRFTLN